MFISFLSSNVFTNSFNKQVGQFLTKKLISNKSRSRRSFRENFILPGTKWCGAGQLAEEYNELGVDRKEDKCCRAHDNCRVNIGQFRRRFGYFNFRPYTISHCRCDRRFVFCFFYFLRGYSVWVFEFGTLRSNFEESAFEFRSGLLWTTL